MRVGELSDDDLRDVVASDSQGPAGTRKSARAHRELEHVREMLAHAEETPERTDAAACHTQERIGALRQRVAELESMLSKRPGEASVDSPPAARIAARLEADRRVDLAIRRAISTPPPYIVAELGGRPDPANDARGTAPSEPSRPTAGGTE